MKKDKKSNIINMLGLCLIALIFEIYGQVLWYFSETAFFKLFSF